MCQSAADFLNRNSRTRHSDFWLNPNSLSIKSEKRYNLIRIMIFSNGYRTVISGWFLSVFGFVMILSTGSNSLAFTQLFSNAQNWPKIEIECPIVSPLKSDEWSLSVLREAPDYNWHAEADNTRWCPASCCRSAPDSQPQGSTNIIPCGMNCQCLPFFRRVYLPATEK